MAEKPFLYVKIDDLAKQVQSTLGRADPPLPNSLIRQLGGMITLCLRQHAAGRDAFPGLKKMANIGKCSERQARRNLRMIENWGVLNVTAHASGGRYRPRYWLDLYALRRALVSLQCNPSRNLMAKIADLTGDMGGDIRGDTGGDTGGDTKGGHMAGHDVRRNIYIKGNSGSDDDYLPIEESLIDYDEDFGDE